LTFQKFVLGFVPLGKGFNNLREQQYKDGKIVELSAEVTLSFTLHIFSSANAFETTIGIL